MSEENDYKNNRSKLKFICPEHKEAGIQYVTYMDMKRIKHCCSYGANLHMSEILRKDGNKVYNDFVEHDLLPQFSPEEYKNNPQKLPYICKKYKDRGGFNIKHMVIYCFMVEIVNTVLKK